MAITERDVIDYANSFLHTRMYLDACYNMIKPPDDVADALADMLETYRLKGVAMIEECDREKEIDYITFLEERGLD